MGKIWVPGLCEGIGADESNRGRNPEIHVGIFTNDWRDLIDYGFEKFDPIKGRKAGIGLSPILRKRGWAFLLIDRVKLLEMHYYQRLGNLLGSLALGESFGRELKIYVDGNYSLRSITYAGGILAKISGIEREKVKVISGPKMDRRVFATALADRTASWLYSQRLSYLEEHPNRKKLRRKFRGNS